MNESCRWLPLAIVGLAMIGAGCEREARRFDPPAGGAQIGALLDVAPMLARYEESAYALANGKRLFGWYNCTGCHADGGGGSGPALMDDVWIYGSDPVPIYQTIVDGRPNGMPSFGSRVPQNEIWQLVAYVRSLSGLASGNAATGRADALRTKPPENLADRERAVTATPSGASRGP